MRKSKPQVCRSCGARTPAEGEDAVCENCGNPVFDLQPTEPPVHPWAPVINLISEQQVYVLAALLIGGVGGGLIGYLIGLVTGLGI